MTRVWWVVAAFVAVAALRSVAIGIPPRDPGGEFLVHRVLISAGLAALFVLVDGALRAGRLSAGAVMTVVRRRWTGRRAAAAVSALAAYHLTYLTYHNLKSWNALRTVRDPWLERADTVLFLGHTPASLLHHLLGTHLALHVLVAFYESFPLLVSVVVPGSVVFAEDVRSGVRFIASMIYTWILGVACYYALPSLGPFHQRPGDFAGLPHTVVTSTQAKYLAQRADFLAHPHAAGAFAQIGAFASLHVAISATIWLSARRAGLRRTARVLAAFLSVTVVATVYVGWHFAVDDLAGLLIACAAVTLGAATVGRDPEERGQVPGRVAPADFAE